MTLPDQNLLSRLDEHHVRLSEVIKRGDMLLASSVPPDRKLISQACDEFVCILGRYQLFKHQELFDPIIDDGPPDKARLAQQMKAECMMLSKEYQAHVAHSANLDISAQWGSHREGVIRLLARINAHIRRERWITASLLIEPTKTRVLGADLRAVAQHTA